MSSPRPLASSGRTAPARCASPPPDPTAHVRSAVQAAEQALRARHPWLRHQDAIGLAVQLGAVGGMAACAALYLAGLAPAWLTVVAMAVLASLTHEMEHDLIHQLYFKRRPWVQDLLLLLGWLARPSTISPWKRRQLHFHHHKVSGSESDLEERAITNGEPWGLRRLLMTLDMHLAVLLRLRTMAQTFRAYRRATGGARPPLPFASGTPEHDGPLRRAFGRVVMNLPLSQAFWITWHVVVVAHVAGWVVRGAFGHAPDRPVLEAVMQALDPLTVCVLLPGVLRTFCLHFMSSNMHYYGNVERGRIEQQTQVLNHPVFWPLQIFCFNFGSTHGIHHFVVGQTFYVRQAIASDAHRAMREAGVVFNDLGTLKRANRRLAAGVA